MADDLRAEAERAMRKSYLRTCRGPQPPWGEAMDVLAASPVFLAWAIREGARPLTLRGLPDILYCPKPDVAAFLIDDA